MFYSERDFVNAVTAERMPQFYCGPTNVLTRMRNDRVPKREFRRLFREAKQAVLRRQTEFSFTAGTFNGLVSSGKWFRPWDVVPSLKSWTPPAGDFGIGIEVEGGFRTRQAAEQIIGKISSWKHITVDYEGCGSPAEVTFPPVVYSKFDGRAAACRYLKLMQANPLLVQSHRPESNIGTHVNVSAGGVRISDLRVDALRRILMTMRGGVWSDEIRDYSNPHPLNKKYFGRSRPYGTCNLITENNNSRIEYKLFNTVYDWRVLRRYVDIAVELTKLVCGDGPITQDTVLSALESGYTKHPFTENNNAAA